MLFPRTVRVDDSDTLVYDVAATPGEWAVTGAFAFLECDPESVQGKALQAFAHGFLGTLSFGWSTLVAVGEIDEEEYQQLIRRLAEHFVARYGAPSLEEALPVAKDEAQFAASICEHPKHTLLSVQREFGKDGVVEQFKVVQRAQGAEHTNVRIWGIFEE